MLKYHSAIVGRLIHQGRATLKRNGIIIQNKNTEIHIKNKKSPSCLEVLKTDENNVTKVFNTSSDIEKMEIYMEIRTSNAKIFKHLKTRVYSSNRENSFIYFCHPSVMYKILTNYWDEIFSIHLPKGYVIPKNLVPYYIHILQKQVNNIKEHKRNGYRKGNLDEIYRMGSYKGYWNDNWCEYIEKCGFLAYTPIYYEIEWDFDLVEKYKDKILWLNLMEDSNLLWTEKDMLTFDSYIPHKELRTKKLNSCFYYVPTIGYGKVELLSNQYIESHKDLINWEVFVQTGTFHWGTDDLQYFYRYVNCKKETNSNNLQSKSSGSCKIANHEFSMHELSKNPKLEWTPDLLKMMIELDPSTLCYCIGNRKLTDLLFQISDYHKLVNEKNDDPNFWHKLCDGGEIPHNAYSEYFTIENIKKHKEEWGRQLEDHFVCMKRTSSTNYHYHDVFTMWDYFCRNKAIRLSYELSKYLKTISITFGGSYVLEDGISIGEDDRFYQENGLVAFSGHKIISVKEIEKICVDDELMDIFMNRYLRRPNIDIVDYLIDAFFKDYDLEDYLAIVNKMKDWKIVYKYK